jgi:hypothetical protein
MRILQPIALIALGLLTACTSKPEIRANTAPAANLSAYKTYTFVTNPGTDRGGVSTPLTGYFKEAIRREMDARGYQFVEGTEADLLVNFNANARENVDVRSTPAPTYGYYGYRGGMYGGYSYGVSDVETVRYKVGTANVDVVDARKKQLLWEGLVEGKLHSHVMKDPKAAVDKVITEMFLKFPGRAG